MSTRLIAVFPPFTLMLAFPAYAVQLGSHAVLSPAGPQSAHIAGLWYLTVIICSIVFVAILSAVIYAVGKAPRPALPSSPDIAPEASKERSMQRTIIWAVAISTILLIGLIIASVFTDRVLARLPLMNAIHIKVTAHQWWWEVRYGNEDPSMIFTTANEMHVPVGRPIIVTLKADDVIHSFWVPNLTGKADLIPGRSATLRFRADKAGKYRGQCAEFCGYQHALMAFEVTAETERDFAAWRTSQQQAASEPQESQAVHGKQVFMRSPCAMCHAIQGTDAQAISGPDLTHLASRKSLAAGALENTAANLGRWISDPHSIKPGTNMPPTALSQEDLQALVAYLGGLK
jgi:cytochrome c oxidase subunit II